VKRARRTTSLRRLHEAFDTLKREHAHSLVVAGPDLDRHFALRSGQSDPAAEWFTAFAGIARSGGSDISPLRARKARSRMTIAFILGTTPRRTIGMATSRCRDVCSFVAGDAGIAIVGLDRRDDRFGPAGAR
jgi:hypothetical protein